MSELRSVVATCDNTDVDDQLAIIAACKLFDLKMVVVTGRQTRQHSMNQILQWNAARMRGVLDSFGCRKTRVYTGFIPPRTIVDDEKYVREWLELDPKGYCKSKRPDGNFADATRYLHELANKGRVDVIGGGPLGEIDAWLQDPKLANSFDRLVCQYGPMGFGNTTSMAGGKVGYNGACNPVAARNTMLHPAITGYLHTSDTTKDIRVGFKHPQEMLALGVDKELVIPYIRYWELACQPRNEDCFPHDLHTVFGLGQLLDIPACRNMFTFKEVTISSIGPKGELNAHFGAAKEGAGKRYVATSVNATRFLQLMGSLYRKS